MSRLLLILITSAGLSIPAGADVSGFEHLLDISVKCEKTAEEATKPHQIKGRFICTYENRFCKITDRKNKSEPPFDAYITVDCKVDAASNPCPPIEECAKPNKLPPEVAEEIHRRNDPNFVGNPDGASSDVETAGSKAGRIHQ